MGSGLEVFLSTRRLVDFKNQDDTEPHAGRQEICLPFLLHSSISARANVAELFRVTDYWTFMDLDRITSGRGLFSDPNK